MINAQVLADSICQTRVTTFLVTAPRYLLAEINTHKMIAKNAASSRAIPVKKRLAQVRDNPAGPVWWGRNQAGMQATHSLTEEQAWRAQDLWEQAGHRAAEFAELLADVEAHKQYANRVIEPYAWYQGLLTATDLANFKYLRVSAHAQPEFDLLAGLMTRAQMRSTPVELRPGQWHVPFGDRIDAEEARAWWEGQGEKLPDILKPGGALTDALDGRLSTKQTAIRLLVSAARCARLSYETHDGGHSLEKDITLALGLIAQGHWSPFEHQGQAWQPKWNPRSSPEYPDFGDFLQSERALWDGKDIFWGPFRWWKSLRKFFPTENITEVDDAALLDAWEKRWLEREPERYRWDPDLVGPRA